MIKQLGLTIVLLSLQALQSPTCPEGFGPRIFKYPNDIPAKKIGQTYLAEMYKKNGIILSQV